MMKKKQRITSLLILIFICLISVFCYFFIGNTSGSYCVVTKEGKELLRLPLDTDVSRIIKTDEGYNLLTIREGQAFIEESDCKNQICVETGSILKKGQVISCLPHGILVTIESDSEEEVDAYAY